MESGSNRYFAFGEFGLDARRRIFSKNGNVLPLTPRNFDLLLLLIEKEGQVLTHDEILNAVWAGTFVEQANLKNAISVLRKVLGEQPGEGMFIQTVPRRGYCFVAPVKIFKHDIASSSVSNPEEEYPVPAELDNLVADGNSSVESQLEVPQLSPVRTGWTKMVLVGAFVVLILIAGVFGLKKYFSSEKAIVYDATKVIISKITSEGNLVGGDASISPNGKYLVYVVREGANTSLWTRQIVTGIARQISPVIHGSVWACALTPDEDYVFYVFNSNVDQTKSGLYRISTFGGSAEKVSDDRGGSISISPDGKRIAIVHVTEDLRTSIETMGLDGSDRRIAWTEQGDLRVWSVRFSPDGGNLLYSIRRQNGDKTTYYIGEVSVNGGPERIVLPEQDKQVADTLWMPDKQSLLMSVRELNAELRQIWQYFPASLEWRRVTNDNASYRGISLTTDGKTLVASQENRLTSLWVSPSGTAEDLKQVIAGNHYLIDVGWTTESSIVYSILENSKEMIGTMNADGSRNKMLTVGDDGIWVFPAPSRDGKHIAFASLRSGRRQIWAMDNDGRNPVQLSQFESDVYDGRLMADGKAAIFLQLETPQKTVVVVRNDAGELRQLIQNRTKRWAVSPDEKFVAAEVQDPQTQKIGVVIVSVAAGEIVRRLEISSDRVLRWTADGKALAYDTNDGGVAKVMVQPIDGGPAKPFLTLKSEEIFSFDWTADGKKFAIIRGNHLTDAVRISVGSN